MNEAAELLMRNLAAAAAAGRPVDIHRLLGDMTMQVVGTTAFGRALSKGPVPAAAGDRAPSPVLWRVCLYRMTARHAEGMQMHGTWFCR